MNIRGTFPGLLMAMLFLTGCGKSGTDVPSPPMNASVLSPDTTVRLHWLGKQELELRMGSYYLMRIWQLQLTDNLQTQTLSRLASAPARWLAVPREKAQLAHGLLEQSLKDVVLDECYLEVRQPSNQPAELAFAIHLDAGRVGTWQTNLADITELLTGTRPAPLTNGVHGWSLHRDQPPRYLRFLREGDWALLGAGPDSNALLDEISERIRRYADPFARKSSTNWLEARIKLSRLPAPLARLWHLSGNSPDISLAIAGDGASVLTHGQLTFPEPLQLQIRPWTIPTALIPEPLDSFTAVRGLQPWLSSFEIAHDLPLDAPPDQFYFWSLPGKAAQAFFAAPLPDAGNQVKRLSVYLLQKSNPWLAAHGYVTFEPLPDSNGVTCGNLFATRPFFEFVDTANGGVVFGGMLPDTMPGTNTQDNIYQRPLRARLFDALAAQTNLVYYDWELTGPRLAPCLYLSQVARLVSRHVQVPPDSPSQQWLHALQPRLGSCITTITRTGPYQLSFFRKSTVGFTGAELQLMADWLESPQFPFGLYSLLTPPAAPSHP
jgi:hypothetical protein